MPNESPNNFLLQTVNNMITNITNEGKGYDTLINILSLLCLLLILNRTQSSIVAPLLQNIPVAPSTNPLQKILGELTKSTDGSGGGASPDMLMSLLPLLNNPQVKSKLNPANISSILGLLSNFSGGANSDKPEVTKTDKPEKKDPPAAAATSALMENPTQVKATHSDEQNKKDLGRSLNWKSNFQNEKEV